MVVNFKYQSTIEKNMVEKFDYTSLISTFVDKNTRRLMFQLGFEFLQW